jgi:hypothetical protein
MFSRHKAQLVPLFYPLLFVLNDKSQGWGFYRTPDACSDIDIFLPYFFAGIYVQLPAGALLFEKPIE